MTLAIRRLLAAPGFTVAGVITLALGIGGNSLTFGALQRLLVKPLPFNDADRLVWIYARNADSSAPGPVSTPEVGGADDDDRLGRGDWRQIARR